MATLLAKLVAASDRAAGTSSRLAKRDAIADLLRGAAPDEVEIAVAWLSGEARQGRIGVGWATLAALRGTPAPEAQLTLGEADAALDSVATTSGKGSAAARSATLRALFDRATAAEQDFLVRLLDRRIAPGRARGRDARRGRRRRRASGRRRASRGDGHRPLGRGRADGAVARRRPGRSRPRTLRRGAAPAGAADARDARRRHRRRDGQARHGGARMEGRRRARAGAQGGRRGQGSTRAR